MIVMINNESVTRREGEEKLEEAIELNRSDLKKEIEALASRVDKANDYVNHENEALRKKLEKLNTEVEGLGVKIGNMSETTRVRFIRLKILKEIRVKLSQEISNLNAGLKMVETLAKVDSVRTYDDMRGLAKMIDIVQEMLDEEKDAQDKESEEIRGILQKLDTKIDREVAAKIDRKVNGIFEKMKQENIKIWETCVDYAQQLKDDQIGKGKILKGKFRI